MERPSGIALEFCRETAVIVGGRCQIRQTRGGSMESLDGFDLDRSVQRAWGEFRERLADHVAKMVDDEYLQLQSPDEGEASGSSP